ncbi:hypothetical protein ABLT31_27110 [Ammoniphilus sp. 3BR4]
MKYVTFGMDVLAFIGQLRFKEHKHRGEIAAELLQRGLRHPSGTFKSFMNAILCSSVLV